MGLDIVEIIMEIEDAFGVSLPDSEIEKMATVGQTCDFVAQLLAAHPKSEFLLADGTVNRDVVWLKIRQIAAVQLGIREEDIRPEHDWIRDLSAS